MYNKNNIVMCMRYALSILLCASSAFVPVALYAQPSAVPAVSATPAAYSNVQFTTSLPESAPIEDTALKWQIKTATGETLPARYGKKANFTLAKGRYTALLTIGYATYEQTFSVDAQPKQHLKLDVNVGRLIANTKEIRDWQLYSQNDSPKQLIAHVKQKRTLDIPLKAGTYTLITTLDNGSIQSEAITIHTNESTMLALPAADAQLTLVATLHNAPAMRPTHWTLYRLDGGKREISTSMRHSSILNVPAGQYEAIAQLNGVQRHRTFTVNSDSRNDVVLAMDK